MSAIPSVTFGDLMRRYHLAAGLTQEALADRTGLGVRSIQHLEGGAHLPHRETVARLARGLGLPGDEQRRFAEAARPAPRRQSVAAAPLTLSPDVRPRHNLPTPLTSFVGREQELIEVKRLLTAHRLVTLTGTGGCGKTRLALRVAAEVVDQFADGVWLVELAPLADPDLVAPAIAHALGIREEPPLPVLAALIDFLRVRHLVLLLDNCEHLVNVCAQVCEAIAQSCPGVTVLATSREALGVGGEVASRVPSMTLPAEEDAANVAGREVALLGSEAARLFVERARIADRHFAATPENAPAIAEICRRLDGIPLALELAAARLKLLSVEQVAARLGDRFRLLTGGSRTALPRQQTLRATLDWSYDLLSEPERRLLRRLSVFLGGCTLEAAEAACSGEDIAAGDVLDLISLLVDKSLVLVDKGTDEPRYRLLETIRQYGHDRLVEAEEAEQMRERHRDWFLALAERAEPELIGPRQVEWLDRLEREIDNLRAALEWSIRRETVEFAPRLAGALGQFWERRDYWTEGRKWLERALLAPGAEGRTAARAKALDGLGVMADHLGDLPAVRRVYEECLAISDDIGDSWRAARAVGMLAHHAFCQTHVARAEALGEEAIARSREADAPWIIAQALETMGCAAQERGDHLLARSRLEESLALFRALGDRQAIGWSLGMLGWLANQLGDNVAARAYYQEALAIARELRSPTRISGWLGGLGGLARLAGDFQRAGALLEESLTIARKSGDQWMTGVALFNLGSLSRAEGDMQRAATLFKEGLKAFWGLGDREDAAAMIALCGALMIDRGAAQQGTRLLGAVDPRYHRRQWLFRDDRLAFEAASSTARTALGDEAFTEARAEGQAMTLEQAMACALEESRG